MQEFFMDYGLWLLIALLVIIGVVFLLSGRKPSEPPLSAPAPTRAPAATSSTAPFAAPEPTVAPVEPAPPAPPVATPEPVPAAPAVAAPAGGADDLLKMKGIGPKLNALLIELGVTRYAQIAGWTDADIAAIDARLGNFKGRPVRDQWVDQAKYLASGDTGGFEAKYGKI